MQQDIVEQTLIVILAAGQGSRMGNANMAKVCVEIDGMPAINRLIRTFKTRGFGRFLLVVGSQAERVLDIVSEEHPEVLYVYQNPQLGTGHAAKVAAEALSSIGYDENILLTLGDKLIEPAAIDRLVSGFITQQAGMALLTIPKTPTTARTGAQVFIDKQGDVLDIIERVDFSRQALADDLRGRARDKQALSGPKIIDLINRHIPNPKKQMVSVGELLSMGKAHGPVDLDALTRVLASPAYQINIAGKPYSAAEIETLCPRLNPTLYLFTAECFYLGVRLIDNVNAQGEYYLTDVVRHLSALTDDAGRRRFHVRAVAADDPDWVQGFNSPEELQAIQDYLDRKKGVEASRHPHERRRAVVFDFDGTLLYGGLDKGVHIMVSAWIACQENGYGGFLHPQAVRQDVERMTNAYVRYPGAPRFQQLAAIVNALVNNNPVAFEAGSELGVTPELEQRYAGLRQRYNEQYSQLNDAAAVRFWMPFPEVKDALAVLAGAYDLFIASGVPQDILVKDLDQHGFNRVRFAGVFGAAKDGRSDKGEILTAIKARGYDQVLFVGDASRDLEYAVAAGVNFFRIKAQDDYRRLLDTIARGFPNEPEPWTYDAGEISFLTEKAVAILEDYAAGGRASPVEIVERIHGQAPASR